MAAFAGRAPACHNAARTDHADGVSSLQVSGFSSVVVAVFGEIGG